MIMGKLMKPGPQRIMALSNRGLTPSQIDEMLHLDQDEARWAMVQIWAEDKARVKRNPRKRKKGAA